MSSAMFPTSAAASRHFVFDSELVAEARLAQARLDKVCPGGVHDKSRPQPTGTELFGEARPPQRAGSAISSPAFQDARLAGVISASRLALRLTPEMVSSGIAEMDALTGGFPRGCLTEICGTASSGRSTLLLAALAAATRRGEFCAVVDASDALDPQSAAAAGIELDRLLWVRCGQNSHPAERHDERRLEQLMRVADLLLESGGFGMIALDLGDIPPQNARRIPLATWFRFRRAVEHTPTVLLAVEPQSIAGSCSSLLIKLGSLTLGSEEKSSDNSQVSIPNHAQLLTQVNIKAELVRSRMDRKPVRSAEITFAGKTAWTG
jgi:recombination protein RecA